MSARTLYKGYFIKSVMPGYVQQFRVLKGEGPKYWYSHPDKEACETWINNRIELRAARSELART